MCTQLFLVKIPLVKQLLLSIEFVVEQSAWGRSAAASPKQKRTVVNDGSIHRPLRGSTQRQPGEAEVNTEGVRPLWRRGDTVAVGRVGPWARRRGGDVGGWLNLRSPGASKLTIKGHDAKN